MAEEEKSIFDVMPGQRMPVSEVMGSLSSMWQAGVQKEGMPTTEFRASQMNLVIHFGLKTDNEQALEKFNTAIAFAQRYPCRLIVLCPQGREVSDKLLEAKLFSQCYIGDTMRQMCCCEALILGYPTRVAGFLSNQVSIWLESDLPTYHWFHHVPAMRISEMHMEFIQRCRRVIFDSSEEAADYLEIPWEKPERVKDLAHARLLPVRQSIGQFMSAYPAEQLVQGLKAVSVKHSGPYEGEVQSLLEWQRNALENCAVQARCSLASVDFSHEQQGGEKNCCIEIEWTFEQSDKFFKWSLKSENDEVTMSACLGGEELSLLQKVKLLAPDKALSEALFFS